MKNIAKLSTCTAILLSTSLYANSLSESFNNIKVKGELKSFYSDSNFLNYGTSDDIFAVGGSLGIVTGDFYGFKLGSTFQASSILSDDNNNNVFANDVDASGAVLSEAFIDYKISNTSLKAGRQYIYTPLVSTAVDGKASESILKDSFEAYLVTNTDIPDTTLVAGYVSKYQSKTDGNNEPGEFEKFEDGAYTFFVKNNSIENLTLQAQYLDVNGVNSSSDKNALYFQADYAVAGHTLSAQYLSSEDKTQTITDGELFGLKATGPLGLGKLGYLALYNTTSDEGTVYTGAGVGASDSLFTAMPVAGGLPGVQQRPDTDSYVGALVVPIGPVVTIPYYGVSLNKGGIGDVDATGVMAIYPVSKNLTVKANYEHIEIENILTEDLDMSRVYLTYKF